MFTNTLSDAPTDTSSFHGFGTRKSVTNVLWIGMSKEEKNIKKIIVAIFFTAVTLLAAVGVIYVFSPARLEKIIGLAGDVGNESAGYCYKCR